MPNYINHKYFIIIITIEPVELKIIIFSHLQIREAQNNRGDARIKDAQVVKEQTEAHRWLFFSLVKRVQLQDLMEYVYIAASAHQPNEDQERASHPEWVYQHVFRIKEHEHKVEELQES